MARRIDPADRLEAVLEAGTRVFRARDFRRAQMADVAAEMGCSAGTLYNYVESKEALFEYVVRHGLGEPLPDVSARPLKLPATGSTFALFAARSEALGANSSIRGALRHDEPNDPAEEVTTFTNELFDFISEYHPVLEVMEVSILDYPDLSSAYSRERQDMIFSPWANLIAKRQQAGIYRKTEDPVWTARMFIEIIAWAAWKGRGLGPAYDEDKARQAVIEIVSSTLLQDKDK